MKTVLVFPPFYHESMYNLPPLGLVNLATSLKGTSHEVEIVDLVLAIRQKTLLMGNNIYSDCAEIILEKDPDLVGFSAQCTTFPTIVQISQILKEKRPELRVFIGGHNASFVDRETLLRYPFIDAVIRGEGEITFRELINSYEKGKNEEDIPGVTFRQGADIIQNSERDLITDLDNLPLPDYSFLPSFSTYRDACELPRSIAILEVGRGCPYNCVYCSESIMWRRRTRTFSVSRLLAEMENLYKNFDAECFLLAYDQFTADRKFVEDFCHGVIEKNINNLPWYCISRLDSVDADLLRLMREAGCESMCYGIDSGSKKTLSFINKKIDEDLLYRRVIETADQGIIPTLSFIIGFPEEEREDIDETLRLALLSGVVGNNNPLIQLPTVLPGTELHRKYSNDLVRHVDTYFALGLEFDHGRRLESDEVIINSDKFIYSSFYNLKCRGIPLEELNLTAAYFSLIIRFYPKSFLILSIEYNISASELFIIFLKWLREKKGAQELSLTPQDCYNHFRDFAEEMINKRGKPERVYLPEMIKYEFMAIEVGKFRANAGSFKIDLDKISKFKPEKNKKIIIERFDFNIPEIIIDIKHRIFDTEYHPQETFLLFRQLDDFLDVSEVNTFVKNFLDMCNGETSITTISNNLYGCYGENMGSFEFLESCIEAVKTLGEMGLIES